MEEKKVDEVTAVAEAEAVMHEWNINSIMLGAVAIKRALIFLYKYGAMGKNFDTLYQDAIEYAFAGVVNQTYYDDLDKCIVTSLEDVERAILICLRGSNISIFDSNSFLRNIFV